tara:strand:- start:148 stop:576 length:429 start_codon:yes stop_codon:yes gene_type:complete
LNSNISKKDKKDWENFISQKESLPDKDSNKHYKGENKTITCDLHGYSLDDANKKIRELINNSYANGVSKLIVVTGKGLHSKNEEDPYISKDLGILKHSVPEYIKNNQELIKLINEIKEANIEDGGSGAFYVFLKKNLKNKLR